MLTLNSATTTGESFYLREPLTITCQTSEIPAGKPYTLYIKVGTETVQCFRLGGTWSFSKYLLVLIDPPVVGDDQCNLPKHDNTMTIKLEITQQLFSQLITCLSAKYETPTSPIEVKPILSE